MSIKRTNKFFKFLVLTGLSLIVGVLALILQKKQEENYSVLLDYGSGVAHADAIPVASIGTGGGGSHSGGNDSGSGDGC